MNYSGKLAERNEYLKGLVARTAIDESWSGKVEQLLHHLTTKIAAERHSVLDFGKSSRDLWSVFKQGQIISADINKFEDYPDIIIDICDASTFPKEKFDAVICHSIIEHVYDPKAAIENTFHALENGGEFLGFAPFIMNYHAPSDLKFQDYFRFTKDGLAYLFRDYQKVTLYPIRGRASSLVSLFHPTKKYKNRAGIEYITNIMDKITPNNHVQTTGYVISAIK